MAPIFSILQILFYTPFIFYLAAFFLNLNATSATRIPNTKVQIGSLDLIVAGTSELSTLSAQTLASTITFASVFDNVPQVLIGLTTLDFLSADPYYYNYLRNFDLSITSKTATNFSVLFTKLYREKVYAVSFMYAAFDYASNVKIGSGSTNFTTNMYIPDSTQYCSKVTINYAFTIDTTKQVRKINAFLTGYWEYLVGYNEIKYTTNQYSMFLTIQTSTTSFDIVFCTRSERRQYNIIGTISYNYIEYIEDLVSPYFSMAQISETSQNPTTSPLNTYVTGDSSHRVSPISLTVDITAVSGIFKAISSLEIDNTSNSVRAIVTDSSFTTASPGSSTYNIQYETWESTQLSAITSDILVFTKRNCGDENPKNIFMDDDLTCVSTCPLQYYVITASGQQICESCDTSCLTCDGSTSSDCVTCASTDYFYSKTCSSTQPDGTYCDSSLQCTSCTNATCKTCDSDYTTCLTCETSDYLYHTDSSCYSAQPAATYCTGKTCYDCLTTCATCSDNSTCDTCPSGSYFFNSLCYSTQPSETYCDSSNICYSCPTGCATCQSNLTDCLTCTSATDYFYLSNCQSTLPSHAYCDSSRSCVDCNSDCDTCSAASSATSCLSCYSSPGYLYNNQCESSQPSQTVCTAVSVYQTCIDCPTQCLTCNTSMQCLSCVASFPYLYQNDCVVSVPTGVTCDANLHCIDCTYPCLTCTGSSTSECLTCYTGYTLYYSSCLCYDTKYYYSSSAGKCVLRGTDDSDVYPLTEAVSAVSTASYAASFTFALTSGFTSSYSSIVQYSFATQKIFYLLLVNTWVPHFMYSLLDQLSSKGVQPKFDVYNIVDHFGDTEQYSYSLGYQYNYEKLSTDFFSYGGGAFLMLLAISVGQLLFILIIKFTRNQHVIMIYDKLFSGFFQQMQYLVALVLFISFCFGANLLAKSSDNLAIVICTLIIILAIVTGIFYYQRSILSNSHYISKLEDGTVIKIIEDKIRNNCIGDSNSMRMYMLYYGCIEGILFPFISVFTRGHLAVSLIMFTVLQVFEASMTIYLRPFLKKLENISFIIDQVFFVLGFILFIIIANILNSFDLREPDFPSSLYTLGYVTIVVLLIAVLINPFCQLVGIVFLIHEAIKNRKKKQETPEIPLLRYSGDKIKDISLTEVSFHSEVKKGVAIELQNRQN